MAATPRTRQIYRLTSLITLLALATIFLLATPATATTGTTGTAICNGIDTVHYQPALTNQPQDVTNDVNIAWNLCTSTSHPEVTSGRSTAKLHLSARSCTQLLAPSTLTLTITWNTGQASTYTSTYNASVVGAVYTVTGIGTVTDGLFTGQTITTNFTGPAVDILLCTAGLGTVSKVDLVGTLAILPV